MLISLILAAGEGSRMKSKLPKGLHKICGIPMVQYVVDSAQGADVNKNVIVVGHGKDLVIESVKGENIHFVEQPVGDGAPYGTGFAVMQCKDHIEDDSTVIVLCGDVPLVSTETIRELIAFHNDGGYAATVLTAEFENPAGYGRIIKDSQGNVLKIVEQKDASEEERAVREINSGTFCFSGKHLKESLDLLTTDNVQGEYLLTDVVKILNGKDKKVGAYQLRDNVELSGINSRVQLAEVEGIMRRKINEKLMVNGVTIINPDNTYIQKNVKVGRDTVIYPGVILEGNTIIGEDCEIGHNSRIVNSSLGNSVTVQFSTVIDSTIDINTTIGPYAYLRPNSRIGKSVKIGDFVEVKNAAIGDNSKASHLAYIGDAEIGKNVNIGCGVVFVNYDGKNKYKTIVEDNAFVGSNSNLVAPVVIKRNGYVAAGSTITDEVREDSLAIARARQVNKEDWARKNNK